MNIKKSTTALALKIIQILAVLFIVFYIHECRKTHNNILGDELRVKLFNDIKGHESIRYNQVWDSFSSTDILIGSSNVVWDMYSYTAQKLPYEYQYSVDNKDQCGNFRQEGDCYNREHSFPSSFWGGDKDRPQFTDLFHIYPTDGRVNGVRGNFPYGEVNTSVRHFTSKNGSKMGQSNGCYTGRVFEPIDEFKGDIARTYFYMVTRYKPQISTWSRNHTGQVLDGDNLSQCSQDILIKWHLQDPVSQKEIVRNKRIKKIQKNYNPYIQDPSLVCKVWNNNKLCNNQRKS
ncbi:MAG: endonuclease I [Candidatus Deianiraeaceae bacterium]|jgi:endonuclease I